MLRAGAGSDFEAPATRALSWRAWLLAPLVLFSLVGVFVPLATPAPRTERGLPELEEEPEERVPYTGELQALLNRGDIEPWQLSTIEKLHRSLLEEAKRHQGLVRKSRYERAMRIYRTFR